MKKYGFLILGLMVLILASCSSRDCSKLLSTVPKNTTLLAILDVEKLADDLKGDSNENVDFDKLLELASGDKSEPNAMWSYILGKDSEADFGTPFIVFELNNAQVVTMALKNADKFRSAIEEKTGDKFVNSDGVWALTDNTVFVSGEQAWITSTYPEVHASDIAPLTRLNEAQSALSLDYAGKMMSKGSDIAVLVDLKSALQRQYGMSSGIWINTLFDSARYVSATVDFETAKAKGNVIILNEDFEPAKPAITPSPINMGQLSKFPGKGNLFYAMALDSETVGRILGQFKSVLPLPLELSESLAEIDGNIVVSASTLPGNGDTPSVALSVNFKSAEAAENAKNFLLGLAGSSFGELTATVDGTTLCLMSPEQKGSSISDVSSQFKNASFGMVFLSPAIPGADNSKAADLLKAINVKLLDSTDKAEIEFTVDTKEGQNALVSLLQIKK